MYELVGSGEMPVSRVMQFFQVRKIKKSPANVVSRLVNSFTGKANQGVLVGGSEDLMVRFAKCCNPIPGDPIIGFVTRGRGISVHKADCTNSVLFSTDEDRKIEVSWDDGQQKKYFVALEIIGMDRPGLLNDISLVFSEFGANVIEGSIRTLNQQARSMFKIEIRNINQLKQIFRKIQRIKGIENITRVKDYINYPQENNT